MSNVNKLIMTLHVCVVTTRRILRIESNQLTCMDVFPPLRGPIKSIRGRSAILGSSKLVLVEPLPPLPLPLPLPLLLLPEEVEELVLSCMNERQREEFETTQECKVSM